jgi:hypothetical protein
MLVSRRKRKEIKEIKVCLNKKPLEQVIQMKYLGIFIDHKFRFKEHINHAAERFTTYLRRPKYAGKLSMKR